MTNSLLAALLLASTTPALATHERPLRVLSFNVAGVPVIDLTRDFRINAIAAGLKEIRRDIALFQEVWLDGDAATLQRGGVFWYGARDSRGFVGNGLLTLSRFPVARRQFRPYSVAYPWGRDAWIARGVLAATLETRTASGYWDVYNTHLTHLEDQPAVRMAQIFELSEFIREYSQGRPYLLAGDLNFTPDSAEAEVLRGFLGLEDPCRPAGAEVCGPTGDGSRRIDYLLVASAGHATQAATSFTGSVPHGDGAIPYSDHRAVEALLDAKLVQEQARPDPERARAAARIAEAVIAAEIRRWARPGAPSEVLAPDTDTAARFVRNLSRVRDAIRARYSLP